MAALGLHSANEPCTCHQGRASTLSSPLCMCTSSELALLLRRHSRLNPCWACLVFGSWVVIEVARRGTRRAIVSRRAADRLGRATDDMDSHISGAQGNTKGGGERVPRNARTSELVCARCVSPLVLSVLRTRVASFSTLLVACAVCLLWPASNLLHPLGTSGE